MERDKMMDMALEKIMEDMDEMEGHSAMEHSLEECPDPMNCTMHDQELGKSMEPDGGTPAEVKIEIHKHAGMPSLDGASSDAESKAEEGLSSEEAEQLRKLLK